MGKKKNLSYQLYKQYFDSSFQVGFKNLKFCKKSLDVSLFTLEYECRNNIIYYPRNLFLKSKYNMEEDFNRLFKDIQ